MGISVREKEHWKERIGRRIDLAIEELQAKSDPGYYKRLCEQAEAEAWKSLGLQSLHQEWTKIDKEVDELKKRMEVIIREMSASITGKSDWQGMSRYTFTHDIKCAVQRRSAVHEVELMRTDQLGSEILRLRREKEELLDTVWLATSSKQIKELWTAVADALRQESTGLQKKALDIDPISETT